MYPPLPLNVPGVLIGDYTFGVDNRWLIAQEDYIGGGDVRIRVSNDGGTTWTEIASFTPLNFLTYVVMAWDGADTYIILTDEDVSSGDGIIRSTDGGDSWVRGSGMTGDNDWDGTNAVEQFKYGLGAWWHMRNESTGDRVLWKSTDNGANWALFFDNGAVDLDFLIHPTYGILAWDVDTTAGGIQQSVNGITAMSEVLTHAAAPWLRIDNVDAMFADGNGNLFGLMQNTGNFFYYNDDPVDVTSWKEASYFNPQTQSGLITFSIFGPGKWLWDGSRTHRRGFNTNFTVGFQDTAWWSKDGRAWSPSPLNALDRVDEGGRMSSGAHTPEMGSGSLG